MPRICLNTGVPLKKYQYNCNIYDIPSTDVLQLTLALKMTMLTTVPDSKLCPHRHSFYVLTLKNQGLLITKCFEMCQKYLRWFDHLETALKNSLEYLFGCLKELWSS